MKATILAHTAILNRFVPMGRNWDIDFRRNFKAISTEMIEVMQKSAPNIPFLVHTKENVYCRECVEMWNSRNRFSCSYRYTMLSALHNFERHCIMQKKIGHILNGPSATSEYRMLRFVLFVIS